MAFTPAIADQDQLQAPPRAGFAFGEGIMGALSRNKGARVEREIVNLHRKIGVRAERVPLSGAMRYQGNGEDLDIYPWPEDAPLVCQVKAYKGTKGTKGILDALGDASALFIRYDAEPGQSARPPLVVLSWESWERLLRKKAIGF